MKVFYCKKLFILFIILLLSFPAFSAGMLVLDSSNLMQAVLAFTEKVSEISQEVTYWETQYNRMARAAEGLVSGDFEKVISSISSISGNAARMKKVEGKTKEILSSIHNDSINLLTLYKTADGIDIEGLTEAINSRIENIKEINERGFQDFSYGGNSWDDLVTYGDSIFDIGSLITSYLSKVGETGISGMTFLDEFMTITRAEDKLKALQNAKKQLDKIYGSEDNVINEISEIQKKMDELYKQRESLTSEDATKLSAIDAQIEQLNARLETLKEAQELYNQITELMAEFSDQAVKESFMQYISENRHSENQGLTYLQETYNQDREKKMRDLEKALKESELVSWD